MKVKTYLEWHQHVAGCARCQVIGRCPFATPLAEAHAAAVAAATGSRLVCCVRCQVQEDVGASHLVPLAWLGEGVAYHSYTHVPKCTAKRARKNVLRFIPELTWFHGGAAAGTPEGGNA
ncbi:hypothetical protein GTY81_30600 [Streptomyces sp. SID8366]|uniref:hypothetical protein n=1 Tax=unclassified Streptomyces TaxID=2593676 RepID=UPI000DBA3B3D|nr:MULTISPECIES: hypothetical protein [unclassified Streptomyces]MYU08146.1 hypothetical protein [Streptomyces sp. SID8366]MYU65524.1 hypothetical protein [Streptomyces sp. SID69]RAJ59345.1 hypothetical protein K376_03106 [Streptomyces sp. PsTaAH-130]